MKQGDDHCTDPQILLKTAMALFSAHKDCDIRARECAAKELLSVKNGAWLEDGEKKFTADQFKNRMTMESIKVSPNDKFELWYDDGDLFWGHSIVVYGTLKDGPQRAEMCG